MDYSLPGSSGHGISQARILEWVAFPSPGDLPNPRTEPASPAVAGRFSTRDNREALQENTERHFSKIRETTHEQINFKKK